MIRFMWIGLLLFVGMWVPQGVAEDRDAGRRKAFFAQIIDHKIECCGTQAARWTSRFENVAGCSLRSMLKARFLRRNKERLVRELMASNVEPKVYQVEHHLNRRFFETLRASGLTAQFGGRNTGP